MLIYIINLLSIPVYYGLIKIIKTKHDKDDIVLAIAFIQMTIIAGLRGISVGVDTQTYQWIFDSVQTLSWRQLGTYYVDTGFMALNKLIVSLGMGYRGALVVYAGIIYYLIYRFCKKCSKHKIMSLFLFIAMGYFASSMNIVRQFIALGLVLISYECLLEKKSIIRCTIPSIIATFFHKSAVFCLILVLAYKVIISQRTQNMKKIFRYIVYIGIILASIIVTNMFSVFGIDLFYMQEGAGFDYSLFSFSFVIKVILVVAGIYFSKQARQYEDERIEYISFWNFINVISIIMNLLSQRFSMFTRLNVFFSFAMIVSIPEYVDYLPIKNKNIINALMVVCFGAMFYIDLIGNNSGVVPYVMMSLN